MFNLTRAFKGRATRAVSLCVYNQINMSQLHWTETARNARYSIAEMEGHSRSPLKTKFQTTLETAADCPPIEVTNTEASSSRDIESIYDGLIGLDEVRLDTMIETDLLS